MYIKDNMIYLEKDEIDKIKKKGTKKITGTNFGCLLGKNSFKKKGDAVLDMFRVLPKEEIDPFYTKRGDIAEKLIHRLLMLQNFTFKTWDAQTIKYDNFPKEPEFGGLLDIGISAPKRAVGEVKSANISRKEHLLANESYICQGELYCELSKTPNLIMFYVMFTDEEEERIKNDTFVLSKEQVEKMLKEERIITKIIDVDFEKVRTNKQIALDYKEECMYLYDYGVPLEDVSNSLIEKLGLKVDKEELLF